jgi:L-ascorbate metabolism protein UlaG (beta-lactamase superfamily)
MMTLIPARIKDGDFIEEVNRYKNDEQHFHLWWLGQSGYLLLWKGRQVLLDPYLSDSLTEKYAATSKPHTRMSERVVDPSLLKDISIVTSSHNHTDHLDAGTLIPLIKNNSGIRFIAPEANRKFVADRIKQPEDFPVGLDAREWRAIGEFTFYGVPASHNEIEKDENGRHKFMGYVIRFGNWTIYHSGDTLWFDGMVELLKPYQVDVALLPINGNDPSRGVAGNLNAEEAALLAKEIGARVVVPCHYDMFTFNTADPANFVDEAARIGQRCVVLPIGGHFSSTSFAS